MLKHTKVIITGAAAGIGKAIVLACLQNGATVIACDINAEALNGLQEVCQSDNLNIYPIDVSCHSAVEAFLIG